MAIQRYTLTDLRLRLQDRLEGVPWWSVESLDDAINEALSLWNLCVGQWRGRESYPTTAGTIDYALASSILFGTRVQFNGYPVSITSLWELEQGRPGWRTETTASGGTVPTRPMFWAPISLNLIHIWPADAVGGNTLLIDGVMATPLLLQPGQYLDLGEELVTTLINGAAHFASFSEGTDRFTATTPYFEDFLKAALEQNQQLKRSAQFRRWLGLDKRRLLQPTKGGPVNVPQSMQQEG